VHVGEAFEHLYEHRIEIPRVGVPEALERESTEVLLDERVPIVHDQDTVGMGR
jgi:hypothetical protein